MSTPEARRRASPTLCAKHPQRGLTPLNAGGLRAALNPSTTLGYSVRPMRTTCLVVAAALAAAGCNRPPSKRTQEQLEALQKRKAEEAKAKAEEKPAPLPVDVVKLDGPYSDDGAARLQQDAACPEGLWALFPGQAPGADAAEKKANEAKRKELGARLKGQQFMVKLRAPTEVKLLPYDAPNGRFTIEVAGSVDCSDSFGSLTIAWTEAKAVDPGASAAKEGAEVTQNIWQAAPETFTVPMKSQLEAAEYEKKNRLGLSARVVFTLDGVKVDKKLKKVAKVAEEAAGEKLGYGGGTEDWGAGRLVRAKLVGTRVALDREKTELFDRRP